jgi:glycerol-3-phosphate acyltransferase PlsX
VTACHRIDARASIWRDETHRSGCHGGGDHAPEEIVAGADEASTTLTDTHLTLVGDEDRLQSLLKAHAHAVGRVEVRHAGDVIGMDEAPRAALDAKPDASINVAAKQVASESGSALVSAGNTGASVLACANHWQFIPGVRRPGFAAVYPTESRHGENEDPFSLILDVGATLEASAEELVAFAIMGSAYARVISRNERPRVALLSNGAEPTKGLPEIVKAHALLAEIPSVNFICNVEGLDIPRGSADVVVCSGFVGNVVIKMLEGVAGTVTDLAKYAYKESLLWRLGLLMLSGGIKRVKAVTDWRQYGGAPLLGFNNLCIKAHGRSGHRALSNAIRVADKALSADLNGTILRSIYELKN